MNQRRQSVGTGAGLVGWLLISSTALGQYSIRLSGVPDQLQLPPAEGGNPVLTASVKGGQARSAWLACDRESPRRAELTRVDENEFQINLGSSEVTEILSVGAPEHRFHIFAEMTDGSIVSSIAVRYLLRIAPQGLDFPWDRATITLRQRASKALPGSKGYWRLSLGDITNGQVLLSILDGESQPLVDTLSVTTGDAVPFSIGQQDYVLVVEKLVNLIIGDDYGVFSLTSGRAWEENSIERLLDHVEAADAIFIRNGQELTPKEFAELLRRKRDHFAPQMTDIESFIETFASRSTESGKPYLVKVEGGATFETGDWLRALAAKTNLTKKPKRRD